MKGIAYEYAVVRADDDPAVHRARSPTGYIPCLVVDGAAYIESVAIIELLEELVPEPALYPKAAHDRARVRALVEMINSGVQPLQNSGVLAHLETVVASGCKVTIDSDAHAVGQLEWQPYGCARAEECGLEADRVVNTWPAGHLLDWAAAHAA